MRKSILILFAIFGFLPLKAQYSDSTFYHLALTATGSLNETNSSNAYLLNNGLNFGIKKKDIVLNSTTNWLYGKQNSQLSNNDFSSMLNVNLYKTIPHFYYWGLINYTTSYSLKVNHQVQAGLGIAYNVIDKENFYVNISNGVLYDASNLLSNANYDTYRNSLRLQYRMMIKDLILFEGSNFIQNSFKSSEDYIIKSTNTLGIQLKKWISLTTSLNYNRMNITKSENFNLTYGITLDKYF